MRPKRNAQSRLIKFHACIARRASNAAPVGIASKYCSLEQTASGNAASYGTRVAVGRRTGHVHLHEARCAFTVPCDGFGQTLRQSRECRLKAHSLLAVCRCHVRICANSRRIHRMAKGNHRVVRARVAIHRDLVERRVARRTHHVTPQGWLDDGIARDDTKHGCHIWVDHAASLARSADANCAKSLAKVNLHRRLLVDGVGGGDGHRCVHSRLVVLGELVNHLGYAGQQVFHFHAFSDNTR
mmetsp:Transcript_5567/g.14461  ORF Transcript_5567/g.14461 Transcript_5567/m.14461 type:complete len:241 (-) Transcript_5567:564-1286(-)